MLQQSIYRPDILINQYKEDVQLKLGGLRPMPGNSSGRGCITEWSKKSQRTMKLCLKENKEIIVIMVRLSYPSEYPSDGRIVRKHRDSFLKRLRRRGIKYFWWLEFQDRGAPHIHLYIDKPIPKEEVAKWWFDIVGSGDLNHLAYGTRIEKVRSKDKAIGYAMSYAKKLYQKKVPQGYENVGRFYGTSEKVKVSGIYKRKFKDEKERGRWLRPFLKWRQAKMRQWGIKCRIPTKQGCMAWDSRNAWEQFLLWRIEHEKELGTGFYRINERKLKIVKKRLDNKSMSVV